MKGLFGACAAFFAIAVLLPGAADAQPILQQRCSTDSLDTAQAEARLNWARRCSLVTHVMNPANYFDTGIPASNGGFLYEYAEDDQAVNWDGHNRYTGQSDAYEVNNSFIGKLYLSGGTTQDRDGDNYYRWARPVSRKKARPQYPTFGSLYDIYSTSNLQLFPHPTLANCNLYTDRNGVNVAPNFFVNGYCESSCYTPEQKVLFSDGYASILDAKNSLREDVITLAADSSLDNVKLQQGRTYSYTAEFRDSEHPIVEIRTASGGLLRVTVTHPVVNGEGRLVAAQSLKVGDELVKADGSRDAIVSVNHTKHFGKVYNLRPGASGLVSNVLVAEGYLVGSSLFQNDEVGYMNRVILHKHVPAEVIP
ncbi:Hint domain-containing protein [Archangium sp.]|uniref:Hint domain-containing protein n=1 Tax=Archangium sp. TaxID=1872627 RepID=UPI00389B09AF